ncbi:MAG: N-acetylneuraminate synthase family protein [Candidatus Aminicenantes bacterium]|nr:MAG: N-acetylneuraminate synthase family protein [Candidatus Aminicenantes bacterium]
MKQLPHIILETANFHCGDIASLKQAIHTFSQLEYQNIGIKFHAFKPDNVALPDFSWYPIVKNFFIAEEDWAKLIRLSVEKGFSAWLDLFCVYGVEILEKNSDKVRGIKLQPSTLDNLEITNALEKLDLSNKELIINIAGLELSEIESYINQFKKFNSKKIILQMGFQDYPTRVEDSSLKKIDTLRAAFPGFELSYADHISGEDSFAVNFPVYAYLKGCSYIEKHVCNTRKETEYDASAALEYPGMETLLKEIQKVQQCLDTEFITANEKKYFDKSIQKPVLKKSLNKGQLVAVEDMWFRRTDKPGMNLKELKTLQQSFFILDRKLEPLDTLTFKDFKKPGIAAIVAARMKSSRLKQKAILPIQGMSSIERCLDNCLKFTFIDEVILATSTLEEDAILKEYTLKGRTRFWQGDPEDVISRYLGACEKYGIDVIIRVTGDSPVVSPEIAEIILKSHFNTGADFTEARQFAVGTNSQVYNTEALKRVIQLIGNAEYSEHMTFYMTNNPDIFKINYVDLPKELIRDYRLTLDYPEDLEMFNQLFKKLEEQNLDSTLLNVFNVLDQNPHIIKINASRAQIYKTDPELIKLLNEKTRIKL